jgi:hypothetical protein
VAQAEPLIHNISDPALLAAVYRACENERQDALFRDPLAGRKTAWFESMSLTPTALSQNHILDSE